MPFGNTDWSTPQSEVTQTEEPAGTQEASQADAVTAKPENVSVEDGFLFIQGGTFLMGSPDAENWRIDDEMQHEVTVDSFCMDPYRNYAG